MPKYEYACKSCGDRTEIKQSFQDDPLTECSTCGGALRRVFSSPGIVLKGPGFYRTDHRSPYRPDGTRPAERDKDHEPVSKGDDSSKTADAKAEAKADSKAGAKADAKGSSDTGGSKDSAAQTA